MVAQDVTQPSSSWVGNPDDDDEQEDRCVKCAYT